MALGLHGPQDLGRNPADWANSVKPKWSPLDLLRRMTSTILALSVMGTGPALAREASLTDDNPRLSRPDSRLNHPYEGPVFLTGHLGIGGAFSSDHGQVNYGSTIIFRPGSAVNFLEFLYPHSAMVLQADYQRLTSEGDRLLSADLILRHYLGGRGGAATETLPFLGLGVGASDVRMPAAVGGDNSRYWSWLIEAGQEWSVTREYVVVARAQLRRYSYGGLRVTTWSLSGAIGIPLPW